MSEQLVTIITYVIMIVGTLVLEHYHIVPDSTLGYVIAIIGGHAAGTNTLIPNATTQTQDTTDIQAKDEVPLLPRSITSPPDYTLLPTTQIPIISIPQRRTINPQDQGQKG